MSIQKHVPVNMEHWAEEGCVGVGEAEKEAFWDRGGEDMLEKEWGRRRQDW